jgi:hypothetical protein
VGKAGPCGDPTGETPFAIASALQDSMLVTDRAAGLVRVFAGVPLRAGAPAMAFHNLRAEGGFLVSGKHDGHSTEFVHIRATAAKAGKLRVAVRVLPTFCRPFYERLLANMLQTAAGDGGRFQRELRRRCLRSSARWSYTMSY